MGILPNLQIFHVRYGSVTELTKVPGIVARAYRTHIRKTNGIPVLGVFVVLAYRTSRRSGYGCEGHTELPEVPGTGMNILQNPQMFFCREIAGVNTPCMVWTYPAESDLDLEVLVCLVLREQTERFLP